MYTLLVCEFHQNYVSTHQARCGWNGFMKESWKKGNTLLYNVAGYARIVPNSERTINTSRNPPAFPVWQQKSGFEGCHLSRNATIHSCADINTPPDPPMSIPVSQAGNQFRSEIYPGNNPGDHWVFPLFHDFFCFWLIQKEQGIQAGWTLNY